MQTILGSGGIIATELAKALVAYTSDIRLVSRNPEKVNTTDQLLAADLMDEKAINLAVKGSTIVYVTIGFPYDTKTWQETWPTFIANVVVACKKHKAKLVFFDNIYMYDEDYLDGMTEETRENPSSKKGKVRMQVVDMIWREIRSGSLSGLIARCADYYGPGIKRNGILREMVFDKLANGKKANWLMSDKYKHSFTYTPDAGKAVALLGNTEDAYDKVWHLPTAPNPFTGKEWIENIVKALGVKLRYQVVSKFMIHIIGWFVLVVKEVVEMAYQYDRDYVFDSSKFENRFDFVPTPYLAGIKDIIDKDYASKQTVSDAS